MYVDLVPVVNKILAVGVVICQLSILSLLVYVLSVRKKDKVSDFLSKNAIKIAFIVALIATCGSLFYSNFAGFTPCNLCWFQRIFMYPEVVLLGLALLKHEDGIVDSIMALAVIGWVISVYNNYIYYKHISSVFCTALEPCTTSRVIEFGYITIPMMALTAFSAIIMLLAYKKYGRR